METLPFIEESLVGSLRLCTPILLAALGAVICERAGVINIALEGIMLCGAFAAAATAFFINNFALSHNMQSLADAAPWLGMVAGMVGGMLTAAALGFIAISGKANQIVTGVAINILALGITQTLLQKFFDSASISPPVPKIKPIRVPVLAELGHFGGLFKLSPFVYAALFLVIVVHVLLYRTRFGLRVRAVGEHPLAAASSGVNVKAVRYWAVLICGLLAGLGGAFLTNDSGRFDRGITGGRGYIALTATIFGKWTPVGALAAALLFGFADKVKDLVKGIPGQVTAMFPYLAVLFVMFFFVGWARPPAAAGKPFEECEE
jgi:simple sugar transport system permease protein